MNETVNIHVSAVVVYARDTMQFGGMFGGGTGSGPATARGGGRGVQWSFGFFPFGLFGGTFVRPHMALRVLCLPRSGFG